MDPIRKKILKLFKMNGIEDQATKQFQEAYEAFGKMGVSKKGLHHLRKIANVDHLAERLAPIWEEHYSEEEVDALIAFYSSPLGKKLSRTQREASPKVMSVMKKWFEEVFEHVLEETT